ncbi:MAG: hemerythrin domain-containing protein, partial [Nitrospirales bacterium]|nr:hemerythrin domain-containing protein [Nitrospirales bacterium]
MGSVRQFLAKDHARLDDLLQQAIGQSDRINHDAYREFRRGLLRHIAMEEKVLLPTIHRLRGAPLVLATKLRLDHAALGALVMPTPTRPIIDLIQTILHSHNLLEEGPGGVYEQCEETQGVEIEKLLTHLHEVPDVSVA